MKRAPLVVMEQMVSSYPVSYVPDMGMVSALMKRPHIEPNVICLH